MRGELTGQQPAAHTGQCVQPATKMQLRVNYPWSNRLIFCYAHWSVVSGPRTTIQLTHILQWGSPLIVSVITRQGASLCSAPAFRAQSIITFLWLITSQQALASFTCRSWRLFALVPVCASLVYAYGDECCGVSSTVNIRLDLAAHSMGSLPGPGGSRPKP